MRIAIVSDTHGQWSKVQGAIKDSGDFDYLFFLGDCAADGRRLAESLHLPAFIVSGNCDNDGKTVSEQVIELGGFKFLLCHGHTYHVKSNLHSLLLHAEEVGADITCFGHTHMPLYDEGKITLINPGSASRPRLPEQLPSWAILEITTTDNESPKKNKIFIKKDLPN